MSGQPVPEAKAPDEIKQVPQDATVRRRIRTVAAELACGLPQEAAPSRQHLTELAGGALERLDLPEDFLGFAMVAVSNAFWREQFEAIPLHRRLLLLPKCLRDPVACEGTFDSVGLHCAGCGACTIGGLVAEARDLGYAIIVAEGTSSVIMKVLEGEADAILGVACLDSLDESFEPIADLGVPNQALPLLRDGCERTEAEPGLVAELMTATRATADATTRTAIPLLRAARGIFDRAALDEVLQPHVTEAALADGAAEDPMLETEALGIEWLRCGGKRLRPFVTVAACCLGREGLDALAADADVEAMLDPPLRALAVAIETLHKASLIHDDIADGDDFRYGRPTLHSTHGVGPAVNTGDWLIGLGYQLVSAQAGALGHGCVADVLGRLSAAQLSLSRGQGAELAWVGRRGGALRAVDALNIGALKTAPAFEVALFSGLRASDAHFDDALLRRFCTYLGEAYQVLNDLEDWHRDDSNKLALGRDVLTGRPTILRAFAMEAGGWDRLAEAADLDDPEQIVDAVRALYREIGAFERARALVDGLRERCFGLADDTSPEALGELLRFLTGTVLRDRTRRRRAGG
jgi:geranylgeranyl pyrophosphate synthase